MKMNFTFMLLLFSILPALAQNDCTDAITVCGNTGYSGLTATGTGSKNELNTNNNDCQGVESNSLWLRLPINTGGTLGFTLLPNDPDIGIDFDFYIFGPNATCNNLGHAIRCSTSNPEETNATSNHTGLSDLEFDLNEGPGNDGNNFVSQLDVQAGDVYFLVIDRPIGASDFSIEWTGTATFNAAPEFTNPQAIALDLLKCDSDTVDDQSTIFNLKINENMLVNNQFDTSLTYHENINDAIVGINAIANPTSYTNTSNPQTLYMRIQRSSTECFDIKDFNLIITNPVVAGEPNELKLCDFNENGKQRFNLKLNDTAIKDGNTTAAVTYYATSFDAEQATNPLQSPYTSASATIWARLENTQGCYGHDITSFKVTVVPLPDIVYTLSIEDFTANNNTVTVVMPDADDYEFSIDNGSLSDENIFRGLLAGPHTVTITAKNGCKAVSEDIIILNYPRFFTPNNDGKNDVWRIPYLSRQQQTEINIFDRYGQLITGFTGGGSWDGTLNGLKLPSTDYWFVLQLDSGRIIKGHFAMIR